MFKQIETDQVAIWVNDSYTLFCEFTPVATLEDEHDGKVQIGLDDGCYQILVKRLIKIRIDSDELEVPVYVVSSYIFKEAHKVLCTLPPPKMRERF